MLLRLSLTLRRHLAQHPAAASHYHTTPLAMMPRRNVVKVKKPSKQLQRRRRNRLKKRRDVVSAKRHEMKPHNPKIFVERELTVQEKLAQQNILTQDPAYAAMADELYENITNLPMELLLSGGGRTKLVGGKPSALSREELLDLNPRDEVRLRLPGIIEQDILLEERTDASEEPRNRLLESGEIAMNEESKSKIATTTATTATAAATATATTTTTTATTTTTTTIPSVSPSLSMHDQAEERCGEPGIHETALWEQQHADLDQADTLSTTTTLSSSTEIPLLLPPLRDFNHVLRVCAAHGETELAFKIYQSMEKNNIEPNETTLVALATACSSVSDSDGSTRVVEMWRETFGIGESVELSTAHLTALSNSGKVQEAEEYFRDILDSKRHPLTGKVDDTVDPPLINAMICGFARNRLYTQAWHLYYEMQRELCAPNEMTYGAMINVCAMEGKSERAMGFIDEMEQAGYAASKVALNTVVKACARVHPTHSTLLKGDIRTAKDVVRRTGEAFNKVAGYGYVPDRHTYGGLLMANSRMGRPGGCLRVLTDMVIHGNIPPDEVACNHLIMAYANAITVGRNEGRRAKRIAAQYIRREEKHALFGRNLDRMLNDTNEKMTARNIVEFEGEDVDPRFLLGEADIESMSNNGEVNLFAQGISDTGLLNRNEIGVNVDDILNVLDSGAYKINMTEEEKGNSGNHEVVGNRDGNWDDNHDNRVDRSMTGLLSAMEEGEKREECVVVVPGRKENEGSDEYNNDDNDDDDDDEYDDWGESLSILVRSAYTDVGVSGGITDGDPNPKTKDMLAGAEAVVNWMTEEANLAPNIFTLNSYLSVHARCFFIKSAIDLYNSYDSKYEVKRDSRTVAIILEMLTRAKRYDRALAFFRVSTGTEHLAGEHESDEWMEKATLETSYVDKPNSHQYGILIRGCSFVERYVDAAHLVAEMKNDGMEPRDADTYMLRKKILLMDHADLSEAEDQIIGILGESFHRRVRGERYA